MGRANIAAPEVGSATGSLLSIASRRDWTREVAQGVSFDPTVCDIADIRVSICGTVPDVIAETDLCIDPVVSDPFEVVAGVKSGSFNIPHLAGRRLSADDDWYQPLREAAGSALERCKSKQVEKEFWNGAKRIAAGVEHQSLTDTTNILTPGTTSVSFKHALVLINNAIASNSCAGNVQIHMPFGLLEGIEPGLFVDNGETKMTRTGHTIIAGQGYTGEKPTTATADEVGSSVVWIYATSPVVYYESEVQIREEDDNVVANNDFVVLAERQYVVGFDPCVHYAVRVDPLK